MSTEMNNGKRERGGRGLSGAVFLWNYTKGDCHDRQLFQQDGESAGSSSVFDRG